MTRTGGAAWVTGEPEWLAFLLAKFELPTTRAASLNQHVWLSPFVPAPLITLCP